jgi:hypothetical protein
MSLTSSFAADECRTVLGNFRTSGKRAGGSMFMSPNAKLFEALEY